MTPRLANPHQLAPSAIKAMMALEASFASSGLEHNLLACVRVPVLRAHAMALTVEFNEAVPPEEARNLLSHAPGVRLVDDIAGNHFPMPSEASGQDDVLVGLIRRDLGDPSGRSLALFVAGDQLLKGAALNAVQIAERLLRCPDWPSAG